MSIHDYIDPTSAQMSQLLWSLVPVVAEQAGIPQDDALRHMRRAWVSTLQDIKASEGVDYEHDGRAAAWRVRLIIWRVDQSGQPTERVADSDPRAEYSSYTIAPGETLIYGLPPVAEWVRELIILHHAANSPGAVVEGIDAGVLASKLKSLRVTLSRSGGSTVWRLRYSVSPPPAAAPERLPGQPPRCARAPALQHFCAFVYVQREDRPRGTR